MADRTYAVADGVRDGCRHCATLSRFKYRSEGMRGVLPTFGEPTATVTFLKVNGRDYAVTANHVIEAFEAQRRGEEIAFEGYFCPAKPGVAILGPFLQPPADITGRRPDVAICPIDARLPGRISKASFLVEPAGDAAYPVPVAIATGFPTGSKFDGDDDLGRRLRMRCVQAVAEGVGSPPDDQVQFFSEVDVDPETESLSGMSGGPVMWSIEERYGLLGFVKEAMDTKPKAGEESLYAGPRVHFLCQRVDHGVLKGWCSYVDGAWQGERDRINVAIEANEGRL